MDKLPFNYKYMKLNDGNVDIFIYNFLEEHTTDEGGKEYLYEFNQFRVLEEEITEDMVKEDPFKYLEYTTKQITAEEKIEQLEKKVEELEAILKK